MKIINSLIKLCCALMCVLFVVSCSDTDLVDNRETDYGYLQMKLYKNASRAASNPLEYLRDAAKIKVTFIYNNQQISQTLNMTSSDPESAEFGLRSENVKMLIGNYKLIGYAIFDKVGKTLQEGDLATPEDIVIETGGLTVHSLNLDVVLRGKVIFELHKDLSEMPVSRAVSREYRFNEITTLSVKVQTVTSPKVTYTYTGLKVELKPDETYMFADTLLSIPAGKYKLIEYTVYDVNKKELELANTFSKDVIYEFFDNKTINAAVPVKLRAASEYIKDYIALRNIWEKMDGPTWGYMGISYPEGANWNFDKDIDLWGEQPGISLHSNGRISSIDLGAFNAKGAVPDDIGQFSELVQLWLGTHNDTGAWVPEEGASTMKIDRQSQLEYDSYHILHKSTNLAKDRMDLGKRVLAAKHHTEPAAIFKSVMKVKGKPYSAPKPYAVAEQGALTNGITSISDKIGDLKKLEILFIANAPITKLPATMKDLVNVTDIEVYNCPKMVEFPIVLTQMPALISMNLARNPQWNAAECYKGIDALFSGQSKAVLQILYFDSNNLEEIPASIKNAKKLALLDMSNNKINKLNAFTEDVNPVQLFLNDNKITEIPTNFCGTNDVETISFARNKLTKLPNIFSAKSQYVMGTLDFSMNQIKEIEGEEDGTNNGLNANMLNLSGNKLSGGMPKCFARTVSDIYSLDMSNNQLDSIPIKAVEGFYHVTGMNFSGNRLSALPKTFNGKEMPYMYGLDLSNNKFDKFPYIALDITTLNSLFIKSQFADGERTLKEWPANLFMHKGIRVLLIAGNDIRTVDKYPELMVEMDVSDNPNISMVIPAEICTKIGRGQIGFFYDKSQYIIGCSILDIGGKE